MKNVDGLRGIKSDKGWLGQVYVPGEPGVGEGNGEHGAGEGMLNMVLGREC